MCEKVIYSRKTFNGIYRRFTGAVEILKDPFGSGSVNNACTKY